jgi:hypothetical protein
MHAKKTERWHGDGLAFMHITVEAAAARLIAFWWMSLKTGTDRTEGLNDRMELGLHACDAHQAAANGLIQSGL